MYKMRYVSEVSQESLDWFRSEDFYYCTQLPQLLSEFEIIDLLVKPNTYTVNFRTEMVGLIRWETRWHAERIIDLSWRALPRVDREMAAGGLSWFLHRLCSNYDVMRVTSSVYAFDEPGKAIVEAAGLQFEGVLKNLVYKDGQYWDQLQYVYWGSYQPSG